MLIVGFSAAACTGDTVTPSAAWAGMEVLTYKVISDKAEIGEMSMVMRRKTAVGFTSALNEKDYPTAESSMEMNVDTDKYNIVTTLLIKGYSTLAIRKVYTDKTDEANNYLMTGYHAGKYFHYSVNGGAEKRLNVGKTGYTDSEFIYQYLRCYPIASVPTSIKVADFANDRVVTIKAAYSEQIEITNTIPYDDGAKNVACNKVVISLKDSPIGKGISVFYTPDQKEYNVDGSSAISSKKFPVLIVENDISYSLTSMFVA